MDVGDVFTVYWTVHAVPYQILIFAHLGSLALATTFLCLVDLLLCCGCWMECLSEHHLTPEVHITTKPKHSFHGILTTGCWLQDDDAGQILVILLSVGRVCRPAYC